MPVTDVRRTILDCIDARVSPDRRERHARGRLGVELRVERVRTTRDIDLRLVGPPAGIHERAAALLGKNGGSALALPPLPES